MSQVTATDYNARTDHRRHTPGKPQSHLWHHYNKMPQRVMEWFSNRLPYVGKVDMAWTVMLYEQGLIDQRTASKLLRTLPQSQTERGWGGEDWIKSKLNGDEDTASAVNYGRTLQEPMFRMAMRDALLGVFEEAHLTLRCLLDKAQAHRQTLMAGQSHFSHAQPTTYAAYLLTVHDGLSRGLDQVALAYRMTNQNSGGCGACSGTGWPVDRQTITDLLGFDQTIEPAYDCESSQDEIPQIMFALASLAITLSRAAMDHSIWALEEINTVQMAPEWQAVSSFMPQKAHSGRFENVRIACDEVIGEMMKVTTTFKGESIQDVLPVYKSPRHVYSAVGWIRKALGLFGSFIKTLEINEARMEQILRDGYSGAPDLAITLIREKGFGGRRAHRICCNFVRLSRERGIKPAQTTGDLLDEAARVTSEPEPGLDDMQVRQAMTFTNFFDRHCNLGDPCPSETTRMLEDRWERLRTARQIQSQRRDRLTAADDTLANRIEQITGSRPDLGLNLFPDQQPAPQQDA